MSVSLRTEALMKRVSRAYVVFIRFLTVRKIGRGRKMEGMEHSRLVPSRRRLRGPSGSGGENGNRTKKRNKNYEDAKKLPESESRNCGLCIMMAYMENSGALCFHQ